MSHFFALFGAVQWLQPLALWGFVTLPLLWWLLRLTPPAPKRQIFPALMLLRDLAPVAQSPAHTPWWLLLLRLLLLALLFLGLARPVLAPTQTLPGQGLLVLIIDNGWAAGDRWGSWQRAFTALCQQAEREQRDLLIIPTAPPLRRGDLKPLGPAPALTLCPTLAQLQPHPWPVDHQAARTLWQDHARTAPVYWFNDGLRASDTETLHQELQATGNLTLYQDNRPVYLLQPAAPAANGTLGVTVTRADSDTAAAVLVTAQDKAGHTLGMTPGNFKAREKNLTLHFTLPDELRNRTARLVLQDSHHAGGVWLLDASSARHTVGLVGDEVNQRAQPLLNGLHYLERALTARSNIRLDAIEQLLAQDSTIIIDTQERAALPATQDAVAAWVAQGGVLIQFAGGALNTESPLLPVPLRQSRRDLGGVFSWDKPQALQAFPAESPFAGLAIPSEVTVNQQLLADPAGLNGENSWALLADGTPLVTGARRGKGLVVLFHVPATPGWSSLPLSGLFVQMLNRLVDLAATGRVITEGQKPLPPAQLLNGFGQLEGVGNSATILTPDEQKQYVPSPEHPPGYYGETGGGRAFNLGQGIATVLPFTAPDSAQPEAEMGNHELRPWLLGLALLLLLLDMGLALLLRGLLPQRTLQRLAIAALFFLPLTAQAEETSRLTHSDKIWLGAVRNGAGGRMESGLRGVTALAERVKQKTAVEQIGAVAVDLETDDLSLLPFLYWPLTEEPRLSPAAQRKLQDYFSRGGMMLVDVPSNPEHNQTLRASGLPLPMLSPLTATHPLYRTFYLLQDCPGNNTDGEVWSERDTSGRQDNVPALFIGARDWGNAWAFGRQSGNRQQEMALRCGVNLIMYALTGNYKMDQIHVPAVLERLNR